MPSSAAALAAFLVATAPSGSARDSGLESSAPRAPGSAEIEAFVDASIEPALETSGVPGAVVVVVRRDQVLLSKGYGLADVASAMPVRADTTLFNIASISKTMTAIIALQLVEEGKLDLDADVNSYLRSARVTGPKVTLQMLLGHRGGFDSDITGLFVPFDADTAMSASELDRRLRPLSIFGQVTAYDNLGYGLIGLVLRDVAGKPLPTLFSERLFAPAGMDGAVLGRPGDGRTRLARCYTVQGSAAVRECEYWLYRDGFMGAGGVAASGDNMARYMRLLLNHGTLDGREVLSAGVFSALTDFDRFRFHPGLPGVGYALAQLEEFRGAEYAHGGSMPGFSSLMKLYPDADLGIFVSFLGGQIGSFDLTMSSFYRALRDLDVQPEARAGLGQLRQLADRIAEEFIPADRARSSEEERSAQSPAASIENFLGHYIPASANSRSYATRVGEWANLVMVRPAGDDAILFDGPYAALGAFRNIGPLLYENDERQRIAFAETTVGRYMAFGSSMGTFRRTDLLESPAWGLPALVIAALVLLTAPVQLRRRASRRLRAPAMAAVVGLALVVVGLCAEWQWGVSLAVVDGAVLAPALWRVGLHAGAGLLVWSAARFLLTFRQPAGRRLELGHGVLLALASSTAVVVLALWRVLGTFPPYW